MCSNIWSAKHDYCSNILNPNKKLLIKHFRHRSRLLFWYWCKAKLLFKHFNWLQSRTLVQTFWIAKQNICSNSLGAKQDFFQTFWCKAILLFKHFGCEARLLFKHLWWKARLLFKHLECKERLLLKQFLKQRKTVRTPNFFGSKQNFCSKILVVKTNIFLNILGGKQDICSNIFVQSKTFVQRFWMWRKTFV